MPAHPVSAVLARRVAFPVPRDRALAAAGALALIAGVFYYGAQPHLVAPVLAPWDQALRLLLYFVLGTLVWIAFDGRRFWAVLAVCALVAGTDELARLLDGQPSVAVLDLLVDVGSALLAAVLLDRLRLRLATARGLDR